MKTSATSCIFLTNDVTKGDWLQFDKSAHNHYLEQAYLLTNNIIFIIHAEQTLPSISFENIHHNQSIAEEIEDGSNNVDNESTIVTLNKLHGFGFIRTSEENLYFNKTDYEGDFQLLQRNDLVSFIKATNTTGSVIAKRSRSLFILLKIRHTKLNMIRYRTLTINVVLNLLIANQRIYTFTNRF